MKIFYLLLFSLITSGCASITTVDVKLEKASITKKDTIFMHGSLPWNYNNESYNPNETKEYIQLDISSKKELYHHFVKDWNRILQTRCNVSCKKCNASSDIAAFGPFYKNINILDINNSKPHIEKNEDGMFHYSIYTYRNLKSNEHYTHGQKIPEISQGNFDSLSCYVIGVTKAPVIFPRSNNFSITGKEFNKIYLKYKSEKKNNIPNK